MIDWHFEDLRAEQLTGTKYSLLIATVGYESRAIAVSAKAHQTASKKIALGFKHNRILSYQNNLSWFTGNAFTAIDNVDDSAFTEALRAHVHPLLAEKRLEPAVIAIDISCMNRYRMASIIETLAPVVSEGRLVVDFWYSLARFQRPSGGWATNEVVGPVHSRFAGLFRDPGRPLALVAGLGYEHGKVIGATEYLQASRVVAFFPVSPIREYEEYVEKANKSLLDEINPADLIKYEVNQAVASLATLDSAIRGLEETHNVVVLPLGPKIFAVLALLAHLYHSDSSVWRVSAGDTATPKDVVASDYVFGLRVRPSRYAQSRRHVDLES